MRKRCFARAGWEVGEIGFGGWAIGGSWGAVDERDAVAALGAALDLGVDFIDTADVYGDGRSERLIARVLDGRAGPRPVVATKAGRRLDPHLASGYTLANLSAFVERSLRNLRAEALDLVQLHCPPTQVFYHPETFAALDELVRQGKIRHYGVSVEKVEEGLKALEYPGVVSIQVILNIFRQRPLDTLLRLAAERGVAVIARVPLASGLLTGKLRPDSRFAADDHRSFNRHGEAFDVGETFSGVSYEAGLAAVEEIRALVPAGATMAQLALRWVLMHEAVTVAIPGAKSAQQARDNVAAADLPPLPASTMAALAGLYERRIKPAVHQRW